MEGQFAYSRQSCLQPTAPEAPDAPYSNSAYAATIIDTLLQSQSPWILLNHPPTRPLTHSQALSINSHNLEGLGLGEVLLGPRIVKHDVGDLNPTWAQWDEAETG